MNPNPMNFIAQSSGRLLNISLASSIQVISTGMPNGKSWIFSVTIEGKSYQFDNEGASSLYFLLRENPSLRSVPGFQAPNSLVRRTHRADSIPVPVA